MRVEEIYNVGSNRRSRVNYAKNSSLQGNDINATGNTFVECLSSRLLEINPPEKIQKADVIPLDVRYNKNFVSFISTSQR